MYLLIFHLIFRIFIFSSSSFNMKKQLLLLVPALAVSSCAKYSLHSYRSEKISEQDVLKNMTQGTTDAYISVNGAPVRKFTSEDKELLVAFNDSLTKNFFKQGAKGDKLNIKLNVEVKDVLKEVVECPKDKSSVGGSGWLGALASVLHEAKKLAEADKVCTKDFTYYNVVATGTNAKDVKQEKLFESTVSYKEELASEKARTKELKNILEKLAKNLGVNKDTKI